MYGIFTYTWLIFVVNVGKYTIHGLFGFVDGKKYNPRDPIPERQRIDWGVESLLKTARYLGSMLPFSVSMIQDL